MAHANFDPDADPAVVMASVPTWLASVTSPPLAAARSAIRPLRPRAELWSAPERTAGDVAPVALVDIVEAGRRLGRL